MTAETKTQTRELTDTNVDVAFPKRYNVVIFNDDTTEVGFVLQLLVSIFNKNEQEAADLINQIHNCGKGIAGTFSREIAEQKQAEATDASRRYHFPLQIIVEKVE